MRLGRRALAGFRPHRSSFAQADTAHGHRSPGPIQNRGSFASSLCWSRRTPRQGCPMLGGAGGESLATRLTRFHDDRSQRTLTAGWTSPDARLRPETETGRLWFHAGSPGLQQRNPDMRSKIRFQAEEKLNL
uniref:Uncharacterized protein n=1 Tax=Rousettus aegyptiacus TaxID=9407 RepID=A0A7J8HQW6_ROUAE|nr:hypothetical protein HJG63_010887 [Rousettus aegyptiacus]